MKIEKLSHETRVHFEYTQPSGRIASSYVSAKRPSKKYNEPAMINVAALGDIQLDKAAELIKAIEIATLIASEELEIE